ncbi:MAG: aspartyl protease family protein [Planctomycetes bacterium]|nr:aspartyl protease family protein [Planctomycetota bacterium]
MSIRTRLIAIVLCAASAVSARAFGETTLIQPADASEAVLARGTARFSGEAAMPLEVKRAPTGHLLVKPRINGVSDGWFILDSGAGICVVSTPHVERYALKSEGEIDSTGVGGAVKNKLYTAERVEIGSLILEDHAIMATDLSFLKQFLKEDIAGVVGYGVFTPSVVELDLATPRIAIHDPAKYRLPEGMKWSELIVSDRIPCVHARFEDKDGLFRLDTGANSQITFHQPAVEKWKLLDGRETQEAKLGGVGGFVAARRGTLKWIELGGIKLENLPVEFATEAKGVFAEASKDGNIGAGLLKRYTLVFEYGKSRIAFMPSKANAAAPADAKPLQPSPAPAAK